MANYNSQWSGAEVDAAVKEIIANTGTAGQVLHADGDGGAFYRKVRAGSIDTQSATAAQVLGSDGSGNAAFTSALPYITTEPSSANTQGVKICVLNSEPAMKYSGYLYIIL